MEDILKLVMEDLRKLSPEDLKAEISKHKDSDIAIALREISNLDVFFTSHREEHFSISLNEIFISLISDDFEEIELCSNAANDELFLLAA